MLQLIYFNYIVYIFLLHIVSTTFNDANNSDILAYIFDMWESNESFFKAFVDFFYTFYFKLTTFPINSNWKNDEGLA